MRLTMSEPTSRRPSGGDWKFVDLVPSSNGEIAAAWLHRTGVGVLSALEKTDTGDLEWHVSVSYRGKVATGEQVRFALAAFDMISAEEDNHVPHGYVRNFWLPVNPERRGAPCKCKDESPLFVEGEYAYTIAKEDHP
jgi:hypothetical protein